MKTNKFPLFFLTALFVVLLSACATQQSGPVKAELPVNEGFVDGKEIYFVHLEASDENAAQVMTDMMKSPTLFVSSLAKVPAEALANVYSFKNGAEGQFSVFDNQPGTEGYTPLRQMNMVVWADGKTPRVLKSVAEIIAAQDAAELAIKPTGIVINIPFITWDGGKR